MKCYQIALGLAATVVALVGLAAADRPVDATGATQASEQTADGQAAVNSLRGSQYYVAAGKTYNIHAHDHVRMLGKYAVASDKPVPKGVIKEHVAAIRSNIKNALAAYTKLGDSAKDNPTVQKQLAEIQKHLASVSQQVSHLDDQATDEGVESKLVLSEATAMAKDLKATHDASKEIDTALAQAAENSPQEQTARFDNLDSSNYYFTGEGHFID